MGVPSLKILITKPQRPYWYWCACVVAEQYVRIRFSYGRKINLSLFAFRAGRTAKQFRWTCQIPRLKTKALPPPPDAFPSPKRRLNNNDNNKGRMSTRRTENRRETLFVKGFVRSEVNCVTRQKRGRAIIGHPCWLLGNSNFFHENLDSRAEFLKLFLFPKLLVWKQKTLAEYRKPETYTVQSYQRYILRSWKKNVVKNKNTGNKCTWVTSLDMKTMVERRNWDFIKCSRTTKANNRRQTRQ